MSSFYLRKPIRIGKKNTYVYSRKKWKHRTKLPELPDEYITKFFREWGDGAYQFIEYRKGFGTRIAKKISIGSYGWRGVLRGYGANKKKFKRYRNGRVKSADHCEHCYKEGAMDAIKYADESDDEIYKEGFIDGYDAVVEENLNDIQVRKGRNDTGTNLDNNHQETDEEVIEYCPKCKTKLYYDAESDQLYCSDESCGWEEPIDDD